MYQTARIQIHGASLPQSTHLAALRLLEQANRETGSLTITWDALCALWSLKNRGSARRHLSRLAEAEIIHYSSNAHVYVTFRAWPPVDFGAEQDHQRAELARGRAESARGRANPEPEESAPVDAEDHPRADLARGRANGGDYRGGMDGWMDQFATLHKINPSIQTTPDEKAETETMLTDPDIALAPALAQAIAKVVHPEDAFRQCCRWLLDYADGTARGTGALLTRLADQGAWPPQPPSPRARELDFFRRHAQPEDQPYAALVDFGPAAKPRRTPAQIAWDGLAQAIVRDYPHQADTLAPIQPVALDGDTLLVSAPATIREICDSRLAPIIANALRWSDAVTRLAWTEEATVL
jgi:predicted transcriptional regulator